MLRFGGRRVRPAFCDADHRLHARYPAARQSILAVNSLWGSVIVQGVLVAHLLRDRFLLHGVDRGSSKKLFCWPLSHDFWEQKFSCDSVRCDTLTIQMDNRRDALITAVAAREGFRRVWREDLFTKLPTSAQNLSSRWLAPVHYYWLERLPST